MYPPPASACSPLAAARSNKLYTNANILSLQNAPCDAVGDPFCLSGDRRTPGGGLFCQSLLLSRKFSGSLGLCGGNQFHTAIDGRGPLLLDQLVAFAAGRQHFL